MLQVLFNIKLDGEIQGSLNVFINEDQSLKDARDSVVQQAAQALGQKVVLRHYLVTVRGRTGYLDPKWEECTMTELAPLTYSQVGLDLAIKCDSPRTRSEEWPQVVMISV